jgi:hypothetical protein
MNLSSDRGWRGFGGNEFPLREVIDTDEAEVLIGKADGICIA